MDRGIDGNDTRIARAIFGILFALLIGLALFLK